MGKTAIKTARAVSVQKSIDGAKAYVMLTPAGKGSKSPKIRALMLEAAAHVEAVKKKNANQLKALPISKTKLPQDVDLGIPERADQVSKALGGRTNFARLLRVSVSQPTRWIKGEESPNSENTRTIVDLEHVVTRARLLWGDDDVVNAWLTGRNGFLDGARPIDVITTQGSGPVIDALDQATAGAFA